MESTVVADSAPSKFTMATWLGFTVGRRAAILTVANSPGALWLGLLFVLSAGFAREYDGEYLLKEPWHLLLPLAASFATSLVLFALITWPTRRSGGESLPLLHGYRSFLSFYWMTAPLAWLYAIPVEEFLEPGVATAANLWLLGIVSVWRVLLITRAASVWLNAGYFSMLILVLFFADCVALLATFLTPTPIWDIMGGIRLPESESIILSVKLATFFFGGIAWVVLGAAALAVVITKAPQWSMRKTPIDEVKSVGWSTWSFAGVLLLAGLALLPFTQPEQQRRWQAERMLRSRQITNAIHYMAAIGREGFPPHWDPPPRTSYGEEQPPLEEVMSELDSAHAPQWLRDVYNWKLLSSNTGISDAVEAAANGDPTRLEELLAFLQREGWPQGWNPRRLEEAALNERLDPTLRKRIRENLRASHSVLRAE